MTAEELYRWLWVLIERHLRTILGPRFAAYPGWLDDVIALCGHQLGFTKLSKVELEKLLPLVPAEPAAREAWMEETGRAIAEVTASSQFVADCERVACYRHAGRACSRTESDGGDRARPRESWECPKEESADRGRIRRYYWEQCVPREEHPRRSESTLLAMLIKRLGRREAENRIAEAVDRLEQLVFYYEPFCKTAHDYQPRKGKTFNAFLNWLIILRRIDVVEGIVGPPNVAEVEPEALVSASGTETSDDDADRMKNALRHCLDRLQEYDSRQIPELGIEARAAFELRYKAYVDPTDMASDTLDRIRSSGPDGPRKADQLRVDYENDRQRLHELEHEQLPAANRALDQKTAALLWRQWELEGLGYSPLRLLDLEQAAREATSAEIPREQSHSGQGCNDTNPSADEGREQRPEVERDYMKFVREYGRAERHLENLLARREAWRRFRLPWIRSEPEIAEMIGLPQPRVSRRLAFAVEFLRDCLKERC